MPIRCSKHKIYYTGIGARRSGIHTIQQFKKMILDPRWQKALLSVKIDSPPPFKASIDEWMNYLGAVWYRK